MVQQLFSDVQNLKNEVRRLRGIIAATHVGNFINASAITGVVSTGGVSEVSHLIATILAMTPSDLTIAAGEITVTRSHHRVDTQASAASDDLDTINGGTANQVLILRPVNDGRTIVIKHNTGNILCVGNADIELDDKQDFAILLYDPVATTWYAQLGGVGVSSAQFYIPFGSDAEGQDFAP